MEFSSEGGTESLNEYAKYQKFFSIRVWLILMVLSTGGSGDVSIKLSLRLCALTTLQTEAHVGTLDLTRETP